MASQVQQVVEDNSWIVRRMEIQAIETTLTRWGDIRVLQKCVHYELEEI